MRSLSRVYKSSIVTVGNIKELINQKRKIVEEIAVTEEREIIDYDSLYKEEYEKKIAQLDLITEMRHKEAEEKAQDIIQRARDEANELKKKSYDEGYLQGKDLGYKDGYEKGQKETDHHIEEALEIKKKLIEEKKLLYEKTEKEAINLIMDIVDKVLNKEMDENDDYMLGLVKSAIDKCAYTEEIVIRVSEDDYDKVKTLENKIICLIPNVENIRIKKDSSLQRGSCILETSSGSIDSSVKTQFKEIEKLFYDMLESEESA
jgi:flagellar assembly protein FliH